MPTRYSGKGRVNDRALDAFLRAKGLTPRCGKWYAVRARHIHKFREVK